MRKLITIVGVGQRRTGTSQKTGKPYDFTPIAFTYDHMSMTGVGAAEALLSQDCCPMDFVPVVGDVCEVFMREDYRTGRIYIDGIV